MKTVQIEDGRKIYQFETLQEIQGFVSEKEIVAKFNFAYKIELELKCKFYKEQKKEADLETEQEAKQEVNFLGED